MTKQLVINGMDQVISDFNTWNGNARINFDKSDSRIWVEVYHNDAVATTTFNNNDDVTCVYAKDDINGHIKIGKERLHYITKFCEMLLDGEESHIIEYQLSDIYC